MYLLALCVSLPISLSLPSYCSSSGTCSSCQNKRLAFCLCTAVAEPEVPMLGSLQTPGASHSASLPHSLHTCAGDHAAQLGFFSARLCLGGCVAQSNPFSSTAPLKSRGVTQGMETMDRGDPVLFSRCCKAGGTSLKPVELPQRNASIRCNEQREEAWSSSWIRGPGVSAQRCCSFPE